MSTLTKEWLLKTIAELEEERDATPGAVNEDAANALAAMKLALASLEAEAVAWVIEGGNHDTPRHISTKKEYAEAYPDRVVTPLYASPPAPVVPEEMPKGLAGQIVSLLAHNIGDKFLAQKIWNACRYAMLQGTDGSLTNEDTKRVGELVMWVKRLAHSLRKANPDSKLQSDAMDYLSQKGLIGVEDVLR